MTPDELKELSEQSVSKILEGVGVLSDADLAALHQLELAKDSPRSTLTAQLVEEAERRGVSLAGSGAPEGDSAEPDEGLEPGADEEANATEGSDSEGGKQQRGEEIPDWKKREYSGPLSMDQALWRSKNIQLK